MSDELKVMLKSLKEDIESLKDQMSKFVPMDTDEPEVDIEQAERILGRKRSWINKHMTTPERITPGMDLSEKLVFGVDWHREGQMIIFKRESLLRFKREAMRNMGDRYQRKRVAMYS